MAEQITTRKELKERETKLLFEAYKKDPTLFSRPFFVEDAKTLEGVGIYIPNKESLPFGVIKFAPQDFIVEEVTEQGEVLNIKKENLLTKETALPEGPTLYATMVKCSISTLIAVSELAKELKCSPEQIRYAGLKDSGAITAQRLSFRQVTLEQLKSVNNPRFFFKDVVSGKGALEKGRLKGNQFTILLRTEKNFVESGQAKAFISQLAKVRDHGFYNYFYIQRFGTPRLAAHYWGMDLVQGYYRKVVESFLSFASPYEIPYFRNLRRELGTNFGDWQAMLELAEPFPIILGNELKVIKHLLQKPDDFVGALVQIQDQATMWVSAFSSWMFNQKVASYLKKGEEPPEFLPLYLDTFNSRGVYDNLMKDLQLSVTDLRNLLQLPFIQAPKKPIITRQAVTVEKAEIISEGIVLKFFLPKGEYATTFLSHMFNLISDRPMIEIYNDDIDSKAVIGEESAIPTIEHFKSVIHSKSNNYFEELAKGEAQ